MLFLGLFGARFFHIQTAHREFRPSAPGPIPGRVLEMLVRLNIDIKWDVIIDKQIVLFAKVGFKYFCEKKPFYGQVKWLCKYLLRAKQVHWVELLRFSDMEGMNIHETTLRG